MKTYKLKDFVTKKMLKSVGFVFNKEKYEEDRTLEAKRLEANGNEIYVLLYTSYWVSDRSVMWNYHCKEDITPTFKT